MRISDCSSDVCSSDLLGDGEAALLVNAQSGRAAVQIPTRGLLLDDGSVERRVRLVRPMESTPMPLAAMSETQWRAATRTAFARAWEAELAEVPAFATSTMHIVTGLLRSEEHTSELQSLMRISYAVFCLNKK